MAKLLPGWNKIKTSYQNSSELHRFLINGVIFFMLYLLISFPVTRYFPLSGFLKSHILETAKNLINFLGYDVDVRGITLYFGELPGVSVVTQCLAKRPLLIFSGFIFAYPGSWKHKAWYIPAGLIFLHYINILRVSILSIILFHQPDSFEIYHRYYFKIFFYVFIFLSWLLWLLVFVKKQKHQSTESSSS